MTKEMLQTMYNEASEEALDIRAVYRDLEAELKEIKEQMRKLAEKGAHYEAIVYHTIEAGANDTRGWLDDEEEDSDIEDEEDWSDDDEDENEDEWDDDEDEWEDEEYPECSKYNCVKCPRNDDCSRW